MKETFMDSNAYFEVRVSFWAYLKFLKFANYSSYDFSAANQVGLRLASQ